MVSALFPFIPGRRGVARRAGPARRSRHHLEVGPALRPETYIRVKGKWVYLYRAVDSTGATIDFLLSAKRDTAAAERFLAKALGGASHPAPRVINPDKHAAYPPNALARKRSAA